MGISYEKWAHCDKCDEGKSYPGDDTEDPPYGFEWVEKDGNPTGTLLCWNCSDGLSIMSPETAIFLAARPSEEYIEYVRENSEIKAIIWPEGVETLS